MKRNDTKRRPEGLCAVWYGDDGVSPDELRRQARRDQRNRSGEAEHKQQRLCRQVRKALQLALADCGDLVLQQVEVLEVTAGSHGAELAVTVRPAVTASRDLTPMVMQQRLAGAHGLLRSAMAAWIHRKRTPQLVFRTLERGEGRP